jgi:hypothetical protein|tara:strand:+ start:2542 stop:3000 length:459 start_codon:yes stop_codon:yes gene_type:complete
MTILRSLLITILVAAAFAYGLRNIIGFWETFTLSVVIQFIIAFVSSSFKINKVDNLTEEFEFELQQLLDLSEITIACPCGNYSFTENIFLNMENTYTCEKCNNDFRIEVNVTPTLLTQPVNVNQTFAELTKDDIVQDESINVTSSYTEGKEL